MKKLGILLLAAAFAVFGLMTFAACNEETLGPGDDPIVTPGPDDPEEPEEPTPPEEEPEATEGLVFELITTENIDDFELFMDISGPLGEDFEDCYACTGLTVAEENVVIPSTYNGLPVRVFLWYGDGVHFANSIINLYIPNSVQYIFFRGIDYASYGNLTNIRLPRNPNAMIEVDAFSNCAFYNDPNNWEDGALYMDGWLLETNDDLPEEYTVKQGTYGIAADAFTKSVVFGRSHVKKVIVPDSVQALVKSFEGCPSLEEVVLPDSLSSIGYGAFSGCSGLTSITIPDSVTSIGERAFDDCFSLTSITIPDSVTSIGYGAFGYCRSLTSVTIPDSVTAIGDFAFYLCSSLTSIVIPDGVTDIGSGAFERCDSLTSITIPDSVTSIGDRAFYDCSSLTSVTIPDSVTSIGNSAFYDCSSLTSVTIGDGVTFIGEGAFRYCESLTSIAIPDSVTSIGERAFASCSSLETVYYTGSEAEWNEIEISLGNDGLEDVEIVFNYKGE